MRTGLLLLICLLQAPTALAVSEDFRPRVILSAHISPQISDTDYSLFGAMGAIDLRLGGFCMGLFADYADGLELPISYVAIGGRLGGYILVNPHLALYPYVTAGYDHWYASADPSDNMNTIRVGTGLQFIIRAAGRFTLFAGPEIRSHYAETGDVIIFAANIGLGVGLGGE